MMVYWAFLTMGVAVLIVGALVHLLDCMLDEGPHVGPLVESRGTHRAVGKTARNLLPAPIEARMGD